MRKDLERRLRSSKSQMLGWAGIQIWIDRGDGTVRDLEGKKMAHQEAEALTSASGNLALLISEDDARL